MHVPEHVPGIDPGVEPRGIKRPLEPGNCSNENSLDTPVHNYVVYTYVPALVDIPTYNDFRCKRAWRLSSKCIACEEPLAEEGTLCPSCGDVSDDEELPNIKCTWCKATFEQKSITKYDTNDEECGIHDGYGNNVYADLQFHQYGDLCLQCRAPFPGEGHFEYRHVHDGKDQNTKNNPLTEFLNILGPNLPFVVWEYYKPQVLPLYPQLEPRHKAMLRMEGDFIHNDLNGLYRVGAAYMKVAGVEHVYWGDGRFLDRNECTDIKLDYRFWRPKECNCTWIPCECVCIKAQVNNIRRVLNISVFNCFYKTLMKTTNNDSNIITKNQDPSFFVYMREYNPRGKCYPGRQHHSPQCERRNAQPQSRMAFPFTNYHCMMDEGLCGQCAYCEKYN